MRLSAWIVAGSMVAMTAVPALALNVSGSLANTGLNQSLFGWHNTIKTGGAVALSDLTVVGSTQKGRSTNVSVAVANTGLNQVSGGMNNSITTGSAMAGSSVTVVNLHSTFKRK
jgi:hypothetical protein